MKNIWISILLFIAIVGGLENSSPCFADEPGPHYKLVEETKPDNQFEFFGLSKRKSG
jgi:hypothetical protein